MAYKEHERISKLFLYKEGEEWAVSRCIHEGIKSLYIDYHSVRKLSKQERYDVLDYLKTHKSKRISFKYKLLQFMSKYFLIGLKIYSHIRYFQVKVKMVREGGIFMLVRQNIYESVILFCISFSAYQDVRMQRIVYFRLLEY